MRRYSIFQWIMSVWPPGGRDGGKAGVFRAYSGSRAMTGIAIPGRSAKAGAGSGRGDGGASANACAADLAHALVVAASPVNRIVFSRIAERACLKVRAAVPAEAEQALGACPAGNAAGLVIVDVADGAAGGLEFLERLAALRESSPRRLPLVIAIAGTRNGDGFAAPWCDATVTRPVTPEALQPVIEKLVAKARR